MRCVNATASCRLHLPHVASSRRELKESSRRAGIGHAPISEYVARFGVLEDDDLSIDEGIAPDRDLQATILDISRSDDRVLVEIDAGSRDGVVAGSSPSAATAPSSASLRIIDVDINRSTGILSLESASRGKIEIGHRAYALMGQD